MCGPVPGRPRRSSKTASTRPTWTSRCSINTSCTLESCCPATGRRVLAGSLSSQRSSRRSQTLELVLAALFLMVVVGIPLGVIAANNSGRWSDHLVRTFYLSGWATPTYLGGVVLSIAIGPLVGLPHSWNFGSVPVFPEPVHMARLDALVNL